MSALPPAGPTARLRVGFAGTPEFAAAALQAILAAGHPVPLVLTQPDRPAGRGLKLQPSAVKQVALAHGGPIAQPTRLKLDGKFPDEAAAAQAALQAADLDVLVVAAYGLILPQWVLDLPRHGCLNIHASLLPRWRGAAPIHRAIEAGDPETGITIMQMDAGLDTGAMLLREALPIAPDDRTATLHDRLAAQGARLIVQALARLAAGDALPATPQPPEGITYAHKIAKDEAPIDWTQPAAVIERRLRAFDPFPGAHFTLAGEAVKLWSARVVDAHGAPGTVLSATPDAWVVACGDAALQLLQVQRPGGKRQDAADLLRARPVAVGTSL
jgi:methionyl-tRNA formyltransferase